MKRVLFGRVSSEITWRVLGRGVVEEMQRFAHWAMKEPMPEQPVHGWSSCNSGFISGWFVLCVAAGEGFVETFGHRVAGTILVEDLLGHGVVD
jgi:hypothetical protein